MVPILCSHGASIGDCMKCVAEAMDKKDFNVRITPKEELKPYHQRDHVFTPWQADPNICGLCALSKNLHGDHPGDADVYRQLVIHCPACSCKHGITVDKPNWKIVCGCGQSMNLRISGRLLYITAAVT